MIPDIHTTIPGKKPGNIPKMSGNFRVYPAQTVRREINSSI